MKTKLLFSKQNSYTFYTLLVFCLFFNYGWSQTNLIQNGTGDLFTVTSDDATNNGWTRNDSDNADAFDMSPSSSVLYDAEAMMIPAGSTSDSPYRFDDPDNLTGWSNSDLDGWLASNCGDNSELPGSSSDGNFDYSVDPAVPTRGLKLNEPCRRLYQKVAVTPGTSYTLFLESRGEAENIPSEVYILKAEIVDETGIDANGFADGDVIDGMTITGDFAPKSNATTNNFTKSTLVFTPPTGSTFIVIYVRTPLASSSTEVFFDNIELYETASLSVDDVLASGLNVYPNPASTNITIKSSQAKIASVELYNILGLRVLATDNLVNDAIDVSKMAKGIYLLKVNAENASITKRIVIK